MTQVKILSIRRDGTSTAHPKLITHRRFYSPISARVKREGARGVDNMDFTLDTNSTIRENDEVYYMQDILDLDHLKGIWNFYGNFRDESGYEQDDYYTGNYVIPDAFDSNNTGSGLSAPSGKFKGYYKTGINTSSNSVDGVKMIRAFNQQTNTNKPIFDMSGDFDIFFWVQQGYWSYSSTLIDMLNDNSNVNKGLLLETVNGTGNYYIKLTVNDGTSSTPNIITTPVDSWDRTTINLIRINRKNGVFKIFINKTEQTLTGTSSYNGDLNDYNNGTDTHNYFYLFKKYDRSTNSFINSTGCANTVPCQLRFYNTSLTDKDSDKVYTMKPQQMTMKFGGNVWKVEDGLNKKYKCLGFASKLLNTMITTDLLSASPLNSNVSRTDTFYTDGRSHEIINDILDNIDGDEFNVFTDNPSSDPITYSDGSLNASGLLLDLLSFLIMMKDNRDFFSVLPRKVLVIERYLDSNYIINDSMFRVIENYFDDTNTANYIEAVSKQDQTKTSNSNNYSYLNANTWSPWRGFSVGVNNVISDFILDVKINNVSVPEYTGSGTPSVSSYQLNSDSTQYRVYITSSGSTISDVDFVYTYFVSGTNFGSRIIEKDNTSINNIGLYAKKINIPQINNGFNLYLFAQNYLDTHKDINQRIKVISNSLVNSVNIGQNVGVHYDTKKIYASIDSDDISTPLRLKVASIEWEYPKGITVIELGENEFNAFDIEKSETDNNRSVNDMVNRRSGL